GLQNAGKSDEAYKIFQENAKKNPNSWIVHVGLARMYSGKGDFSNASKEMATAVAGAPDPQKQPLQAMAKRLDAKEDINKYRDSTPSQGWAGSHFPFTLLL